jgi:hypothetical protein
MIPPYCSTMWTSPVIDAFVLLAGAVVSGVVIAVDAV